MCPFQETSMWTPRNSIRQWIAISIYISHSPIGIKGKGNAHDVTSSLYAVLPHTYWVVLWVRSHRPVGSYVRTVVLKENEGLKFSKVFLDPIASTFILHRIERL